MSHATRTLRNMKVTVLEYEEDPLFQNGDSSSSSQREHAISEYTLELSEGKNASKPTVLSRRRRHNQGNIFRSPLKVLTKLFLPLGYPHSVSNTYLPYQLYDGLQGLCSYWRGVVSAKAVFEAAGVGNAEATALSAALSWALRDGTGMIGGLTYSYIASSYFDSHAKEFRLLLADVINDVALALDMIAPYFGPGGSIWVLGLSTIGKTICGITAGATKGHITQHFANDGGNVADLTAKESTQETLVSLLGMIGGVWVAKLLDKYGQNDPIFWTWVFFGALTLIHVWANYKAVSLLKLTTLNPERTRTLFCECIDVMAKQAVLNETQAAPRIMSPKLSETVQRMASPEYVHDSLFSSIWYLVFPRVCTSRSLKWDRLQDCSICKSDFEGDGENAFSYVIGYDNRDTVCVWLKVGASLKDELQAYIHGLVLEKALANGGKKPHFSLIERYVCCIRYFGVEIRTIWLYLLRKLLC